MRIWPGGIGGKLYVLVAIATLAVAIVVALAMNAFESVERLSGQVSAVQLRQVIDNAALGRELTTLLSEIDLAAHTCRDVGAMGSVRDAIAARLDTVRGRASDPALGDSIAALARATDGLFDACGAIGTGLGALAATDRDLLGALERLENLTGRALVEQTIAGKPVEHLDQIMTLVAGYRETVLEIGKQMAVHSAYREPRVRLDESLRPMIDDLALRLQGFAPASREMAGIAARVGTLVRDYRAQVLGLDASLRGFASALQQGQAAREAVLAQMNRLDTAVASHTGELGGEIAKVVHDAHRQVLALSLVVAVVAAGYALRVARRSIRAPLEAILDQVAGIRHGTRDLAAERRSADEWGAIRSALTEMASELEQSSYMLKKVLDTVPIRVFWKDRDLRYIGCNPPFARDAGKRSPDEVAGLDDTAMPWAAQADACRADDRHVLQTGTEKLGYEEAQAGPDGRVRWLRTSKVPLRNRNDEIIGILGIHDDVTAWKDASLELERYRHHLESLVSERTSELTLAREVAEAANRAKTTFLANMSHELRTPMNGVLGMIELARRRERDPGVVDLLAKAESSALRLLGILNDILDLSKIEADRMTIAAEPFELGQVVENLKSLLGGRAAQKGLSLAFDVEPRLAAEALVGDPLRLGQVLTNLVGNAIKFSAHGEVGVRIRAAESSADGHLLRFEVRDEGIGIGAHDQARLFEAFEQADGSMTRKYGGSGLGLAICRRLAALMGGAIGVESTPGAGSTFWFTARVARADAARGDAAAGGAARAGDTRPAEQLLAEAFAGARILVVEDEPINREVVASLLVEAGLRVDVAEDGEQALDLARSRRYDAILMDVRMPRLDGLESARGIRSDPTNRDTPILAMTAHAFEQDRQDCLDAGMDDHVGKPVAPHTLFERLLAALRQRRGGVTAATPAPPAPAPAGARPGTSAR